MEKSGDPGINKQDKNRVVVLIEPDDSVRDALTLLLEGEDWVVRPLPGCEELAEALKVDGIVAVLSESSLPNCTPQEILELCSVNEIPVIFTGHDLPLQGAVDLIRQGAQDFLDKPFPQSRLLDLLQGLN